MKLIIVPKDFNNHDSRLCVKTIIFKYIGDVHPFTGSPIFTCKNVIFDRCNKNFVYYWLKPTIFPNVKNIYLKSNPADPKVLHRFDSTNIYFHPHSST